MNTSTLQSRNNFYPGAPPFTTIDTSQDGQGAHKPNILNATGYERLKTLMLGTTLKLDSTLIAFKGLISDKELEQHIDQDFYYEFDKLMFEYSK